MATRNNYNSKKGITVLSLFDGCSMAQVALQRAGIRVKKYYASEVNPIAISQTQKNFPKTIQVGSVEDIAGEDFEKIDLLIGGSPCQGFSYAGGMLNFNHPESKLFFEFARIFHQLKELNPKLKFLLENVLMKPEFSALISFYMQTTPVCVNSNLVFAQNRNRLYWTNLGKSYTNFFGYSSFSEINPIKDRNIFLSDILDISPQKENRSLLIRDSMVKKYFKKFKGSGLNRVMFTSERSEEGKLIRKESIAVRKVDYTPRQARVYKPRTDNKSNTLLTSQNKDLVVIEDDEFRNLSVAECCRLQTMPENYFSDITDRQAVKLLGNGFTVDVIVEILKNHYGNQTAPSIAKAKKVQPVKRKNSASRNRGTSKRKSSVSKRKKTVQ